MSGKRMNKKGQVTMFVIIAVLIVAIAVLIYLFYPKINAAFSGSSENPYIFIQDCLEDSLVENVEILSKNGGSINPEHYIVYNGDSIEYLCYTSEYYQPCIMQQPLLKAHIENELNREMGQKVKECFSALRDKMDGAGYDVNLREGDFNVELLPKRIVMNFNHSLTLTKDSTENFNSFRVVVNNNLYELTGITNSILNWETKYGDAETTTYMNYYRDLKVEKKKQMDGSTIYILTDRNNENKFQFASRSIAWPPGYE